MQHRRGEFVAVCRRNPKISSCRFCTMFYRSWRNATERMYTRLRSRHLVQAFASKHSLRWDMSTAMSVSSSRPTLSSGSTSASTLSNASLNVHRMFTECLPNVHWMFTDLLLSASSNRPTLSTGSVSASPLSNVADEVKLFAFRKTNASSKRCRRTFVSFMNCKQTHTSTWSVYRMRVWVYA